MRPQAKPTGALVLLFASKLGHCDARPVHQEGQARRPRTEAVVLFASASTSHRCAALALQRLVQTAGPDRDVWLLTNSTFLTPATQTADMVAGREVQLPRTLTHSRYANSSTQPETWFVAWLAGSIYEKAWFVGDRVALEGRWSSLFDADYGSPADIVARTSILNNSEPCFLRNAKPCSIAGSGLRVDWSAVRLSRRVATRIVHRADGSETGARGPASELVPAVCIHAQPRCRVAPLDGSPGRLELKRSASRSASADKCDDRSFVPDARATLFAPTSLMLPSRFDIYVKWAYAKLWVEHGGQAPAFATDVYVEHLARWNGFREATCAWFKNFHANCTNKHQPGDFVRAFNALLGSMQTRGYVGERGSSIPLELARDGSQVLPINGAHRVAAAAALRVDRIPAFLIPPEAVTLYSPVAARKTRRAATSATDYAFFLDKGLSRTHADWVVHHAVLEHADLHVVHLWPRATSYGSELRERARRVVEQQCAVDGAILYAKDVALSRKGLEVYLRHAYGDVNWLQPGRYWAQAAPLAVFVVRSDRRRASSCKRSIRKLFALPGDLQKAAVHVTDFHSEARVATQMLLNDNSVAYMNHPNSSWSLCNRVAAGHSASLESVGTPRLPVLSTHPRSSRNPFFLLPEEAIVDTGAAMAILGLRAFTDVDLVWSTRPSNQIGTLVKRCSRRRARGCIHRYGTHNPPTVWWSFHNQSSPADVVNDPRLYGFCSGLKFVAPLQLIAYKRARFAARHEAKDRRDANLLMAAWKL